MMLVRGFDLLFSNASDEEIKIIAKHIGGNCDFDLYEGRVTYMFGKELYMPKSKTGAIHKAAKDLGERLQREYDCKYEHCEYYLKISKYQEFYK